MAATDLLAEHARLTTECSDLRELCYREFAMMSAQVAKARADRLDAIGERLKAIEKTRAWKGRPRVEE